MQQRIVVARATLQLVVVVSVMGAEFKVVE
jgi:hypothetical protein